jgi:hypothetical protein
MTGPDEKRRRVARSGRDRERHVDDAAIIGKQAIGPSLDETDLARKLSTGASDF